MKSRNFLASILGVSILTSFGLSGVSMRAEATLMCGPAPLSSTWMGTCLSDTDLDLSSLALHGEIQIIGDGIFTLPPMFGAATIFRGDPMGGPNQFTINTEMVSLNLSGGGFTLHAGDGIGNLMNNGPFYSPGMIVGRPNSPLADSFFDIFFEISGPNIPTVHNNIACTMHAVIDRVPPYLEPYTGCINPTTLLAMNVTLFDVNNNPVAQMIGGTATHILCDGLSQHECLRFLPEPSNLLLLGAGALVFAAYRRKKVGLSH